MTDGTGNQVAKVKNNFQNYCRDLPEAISSSDKKLLECAKHYHIQTSLSSEIHLNNWHLPLSFLDDTLIRYHPYQFQNLNPVQQHSEILRAEAEAYLIHYRLGYCKLDEVLEEKYSERALGILPQHIDERLAEILSGPGFRTVGQLEQILAGTEELKKKAGYLRKEYGIAATLVFFLSLQNGIKISSQIINYGHKIDLLVHKITMLPQIQTLIDKLNYEDSFELQFILLASLRDRIVNDLPHRIHDELVIQLNDILDADWENQHDIRGSELLFTVVDAIILSRFGFDINCVIYGENLLLEIITSEKTVYWEPLSSSPVLYKELLLQFRGDFMFLIGQTFAKIANVHVKLGRRLDKAVEYYNKAIDISPGFPDTYARLAQLYIRNQNPQQAIVNIQKAVDINSNSSEYFEILGLAYCLTNDWSSAVVAFRSAVSLKPNNFEAQNNLAYSYEQHGDLNKAEEIYHRLVTLRPDYFEANFGLGNVYFGLKQFERALMYFEKALKINPSSKHAMYNIAQTFYEKGDFNRSIRIYKELLRLEPNYATVWYNLGIIYRNKGMKKEAVKCLEQAVRLNPNLMK